jgi:3-methyladenine DNA glycosylase/8-oxoguanine DNA glycosylase
MIDAAGTIRLSAPFSLAATCGPVHWTTGRSARHAWSDGVLTWVGWEGERAVWRSAHQVDKDCLVVEGDGDPHKDQAWAAAVLGSEIMLPRFDDPVMGDLAATYPGLRPYCDGSVFEGVITAIVGQSISVAAAAVTQAKLSALFGNEVTVNGVGFRPLPRADQLAEASAELIRSSGVTWKRAEAIRHAATEALRGNLPGDEEARRDPDEIVRALMTLPLVGRWTAESVVLWGVGAPNAHPTGDVALLRAAKHAYNWPDLTLKTLDALAEQWQPARGLAARLLWTHLFGPAPERSAA